MVRVVVLVVLDKGDANLYSVYIYNIYGKVLSKSDFKGLIKWAGIILVR